MGLLPLEFTDCLTDSPYFRENLHAHERELERTSQDIKNLIKDVKDLLLAAKNLSKAQRNFSSNLKTFKFECIGSTQTDDEIVIAGALKEFGRLVAAIEDERDRMLENAYDQFIVPLETFRKEHIGGAKERKKKFDKHTYKFCQSMERHLNLSTKKTESQLQEADACLEMEQRSFCQASLEYICLLQEVQERKKFEFIETLLGFLYSWMTFYHQGHEVASDYRSYMTDLQVRIQKTRENFNSTRDETVQLMNKMLEVRKTKAVDPGTLNKMYTRQGYLFLLEKKALGTTTWTKHYCQYQKENKIFTMIPYSQTAGKITNTDTMKLKSCVRRMSESIEKRFCFDITAEDRPGCVYTLQALCEEDRRHWMDAMDGKEPTYSQPCGTSPKGQESRLDDIGFSFVNKCIGVLEQRGLEDQGLYRLVGVGSKVSKLLHMGLDKRRFDRLNLEDDAEWENKTLTSALKTYFRNLPEPVMTFKMHHDFVSAAKQDNQLQRLNQVHTLVFNLPQPNKNMLQLLTRHLCNIAAKSDKNLMTVSNLGVCFGPTLLRPREETVAAIMDIKFGNIVVEILIENYDKIFESDPEIKELPKKEAPPLPPPPAPSAVSSYLVGAKGILTASIMSHGLDSFIPNPNPSTPNNPGKNGLSETTQVSTNHIRQSTNNQTPKPLAVFNPFDERSVSNSSSNESINSRASITPQLPNSNSKGDVSLNYPTRGSTTDQSDIIYPEFKRRLRKEGNRSSSVLSQMSGSSNNLVAVVSPLQAPRRVRTLYQCVGENESELSFEPNQIIENARPSKEPGWLEGTLNGQTGLIPENYVEYV